MIGWLAIALSPFMGFVGTGSGRSLQSAHHFAIGAQSSDVGGSNDADRTAAGMISAIPVSVYRLSGEKSLRPMRIGDDGTHMYLEWSEEQALPAVFAVNALGDEEMVDGYMRQGIFTIDRVHNSLVFIIGKKRAKATRVNK